MAIFKYFTNESHAQTFIQRGQLLLRPLSYFRAYEDDAVRGDVRDGVLAFAPGPDLPLTKQDGTVVNLPGGRFTSSAADDVFVFCASNKLSIELAERFGSPFCVEIADPVQLVSRLKARAHPTSHLDYSQAVGGSVEYRAQTKEPGVDWALPEKLIFIKPEAFAWQDEYRIAVGTRGAMEAQNVECKLEVGPAAPEDLAASPNPLSLRVQSLAAFTKLHRF